MKRSATVSFVMIGMLISGGQRVRSRRPRTGMERRPTSPPINRRSARKAYPYTGDLKLTFNHGIITGTYSSISARPDPYYGRIIASNRRRARAAASICGIGEYLAAERNDREGRNDSGHGQLEREVVYLPGQTAA